MWVWHLDTSTQPFNIESIDILSVFNNENLSFERQCILQILFLTKSSYSRQGAFKKQSAYKFIILLPWRLSLLRLKNLMCEIAIRISLFSFLSKCNMQIFVKDYILFRYSKVLLPYLHNPLLRSTSSESVCCLKRSIYVFVIEVWAIKYYFLIK